MHLRGHPPVGSGLRRHHLGQRLFSRQAEVNELHRLLVSGQQQVLWPTEDVVRVGLWRRDEGQILSFFFFFGSMAVRVF